MDLLNRIFTAGVLSLALMVSSGCCPKRNGCAAGYQSEIKQLGAGDILGKCIYLRYKNPDNSPNTNDRQAKKYNLSDR